MHNLLWNKYWLYKTNCKLKAISVHLIMEHYFSKYCCFTDTSNGPKFFIVKKLQTFFNPWKLLPMNIYECRDVLMGRTVWGFGRAVEDGVYLVDRGRNQLYYQRDLLLHTGVLVTGMKQLLDSRLLNKTRGDISCYFYILWIS